MKVTPKKLGQPCWSSDDVAVAVTRIAKVDRSQVDYFLATHSPIDELRDDKLNLELDEEALFSELAKGSRAHTLAVVRGDPGTGKSHLIHWLKLSWERALAGARRNG